MMSLFSQEEVTKQFGEEQWEEGHAAGLEQGIEQGLTKGLSLINSLTQALLKDNRMEDLQRSLNDPEFQQLLLKEYGLTD